MPDAAHRRRHRPRIAITIGDINGIGPEVILKVLSDHRISRFFEPVVVGPAIALKLYARVLGLKHLQFQPIERIEEIDDMELPEIPVVDPGDTEPPEVRVGEVTEFAGRTAMWAVEKATDLCVDGTVDGMVTAPISKEAIARAGYGVTGHTEFIAKRTNSASFTMLMLAQQLRVALVTTHVPLSQVSGLINQDAIIEKLEILGNSLTRDFGVSRPRIAVLGLNPHASDGGVIGTEEQEIIEPAIAGAREDGALVYGPFPGDGFFASRKYTSFDAVLAMYHDQGLGPFKALSFNSGINFTAGLPIVRTSPDHGTAFDIAGQDKASCESIRNAIYTAIDITRRRGPLASHQQAA